MSEQPTTPMTAATESIPFDIEPAPKPAGPGYGPDEDRESSTASITSSILEYRAINGRTYHSARYPTEYFTPNDQPSQESIDIAHYHLTVLLHGKLFLAPIPQDVKAVLDIGTGTGIWAIDFAEAYPDCQVTATELSPMQPSWVPANVKFEIDDATLPWTWAEDSFDFVHMRLLSGAISDWTALLRQAYRCCKPGGWVQSGDVDAIFESDDGTLDANPVLHKWNEMFREASRKVSRSFTVISDDLQRKAMEEAGFVDITVVNLKLPIGGWAREPRLKQAGCAAMVAMEADLEGHTQHIWHRILEWPQDEYPVFLRDMQIAMRSRRTHSYMRLRYVYGRKPAAA